MYGLAGACWGEAEPNPNGPNRVGVRFAHRDTATCRTALGFALLTPTYVFSRNPHPAFARTVAAALETRRTLRAARFPASLVKYPG
ncbi:MAG: hypothetical protein BroJett031_30250 [Betaproteobacteria bacterium]|nr:MAG: hypothetical protein BroJett031_30250 [Betaproteobacteria bacterium]